MTITADQDNDDPWVLRPGKVSTTAVRPPLQIETIDNFEPLNTQIGSFPKRSVPDALHVALFGQPAPTKSEIAAAGGDASGIPPLQTYAVLDAAKLINLPELLEDSGLEHRCLFKGDAYDELKDVAPWLVRLEEGNSFTRNLFTRSDAPWHFWDSEPGIYIRSRAGLAALNSHLRKFFKVRDETGAWYYLRLHAPRVTRALLRAAPAFGQRLLVPQPQSHNLTVITCVENRAEIVRPSLTAQDERLPIRIGPQEGGVPASDIRGKGGQSDSIAGKAPRCCPARRSRRSTGQQRCNRRSPRSHARLWFPAADAAGAMGTVGDVLRREVRTHRSHPVTHL